jgi:hypothetical protein
VQGIVLTKAFIRNTKGLAVAARSFKKLLSACSALFGLMASSNFAKVVVEGSRDKLFSVSALTLPKLL